MGDCLRGKGKIVVWNDSKGFGFIEPFDGGPRLFIHVSAFSDRRRRPDVSGVVTYTLSTGKNGKPQAVNATLAGAPPRTTRPRSTAPATPMVATAALFYTALIAAELFARVPALLPLIYIVLGAVTYFAYVIDKSAAERGKRRIPENTLHALSLLGGWPAALIARHRLRHKTRKQPFRFLFWITVAGNLAGLGWIILGSEAGCELTWCL